MPLINGTNGNDIITSGTSGDDTINGLDGNDRIEVTLGTDLLDGGNGIDTLSFRNTGLPAGSGVLANLGQAAAQSLGSGTLATTFLNFENIWGTEYNDQLYGNALANELAGFGGDDYLTGGSTAAPNTLIGGAGNDTYGIMQAGDTIVELPGEGTDQIVYNAFGQHENGTGIVSNLVIVMPANVENVVPHTYAQANPLGQSLTVIGNAENNQITGNGMADYLSGGAGNDILTTGNVPFFYAPDTLVGGTGDDTYVISTPGDTIIELAGEGNDTVEARLSTYVLPDNVENLLFSSSLNHVTGIGNALGNYIAATQFGGDLFGRGGDDILAAGPVAPSTLVGGTGNDQYYVAAVGDSVVEYAGEGFDTASVVGAGIVAFTLPANVEALVWGTSGSGICIGNAGDNTISVQNFGSDDFLSGMDGNDILIGGKGDDLLIGGNGADQFQYSRGETGLDRIIDFTPGQDKIALLSSAPGQYVHTATVDFVSSAAPVATTTHSTFLYDMNTGIVSYDEDGTGSGAAVQLAQLNAGLTLSASDFIFV